MLVRIFLDRPLTSQQSVALPDAASHHLGRVLRMRKGQAIQVFNGTGGYYVAEISAINRKSVTIFLTEFVNGNHEPELTITLIQGISRSQHMDYTIQKAVELGVSQIVPVFSRYSNVRLNEQRNISRHEHWQKIIISACEQCGTYKLPVIEKAMSLTDWIVQDKNPLKLVLDPRSSQRLSNISYQAKRLSFLSGPEGGLDDNELLQARENGYLSVCLGPRILRTETAAIAAISAFQTLWGDMR